MLRRISELFIAATDVAVEQVRALAQVGRDSLRGIIMTVIFAVVTVAGAGWLFAGVYLWLKPMLGAAGAALTLGGAGVLVGVIGMMRSSWSRS